MQVNVIYFSHWTKIIQCYLKFLNILLNKSLKFLSLAHWILIIWPRCPFQCPLPSLHDFRHITGILVDLSNSLFYKYPLFLACLKTLNMLFLFNLPLLSLPVSMHLIWIISPNWHRFYMVTNLYLLSSLPLDCTYPE